MLVVKNTFLQETWIFLYDIKNTLLSHIFQVINLITELHTD